MGTLAVRDDLLTRIAKLAEASRLPLEAQAEKLLIDSIRRTEAVGELKRLMDSIAAMTPREIHQTDTVELLREDRGR
jgi:antitoxin FitA